MHGLYLGTILSFQQHFFLFLLEFSMFFSFLIKKKKKMNRIIESKKTDKETDDKTYFISSSNFEITPGEIHRLKELPASLKPACFQKACTDRTTMPRNNSSPQYLSF